MNNKELTKINEEKWQEFVEKGDLYTLPWLNLKPEDIIDYLNGNIVGFHGPYNKAKLPERLIKIRQKMFGNLSEKKVLCLASGGGQQSVLFGLLNAKEITVLDLSKDQLINDEKAARHYGYEVKTVQGDMRDLSMFDGNYFDLVYQPISICFVPDIAKVYEEVFRILIPGGYYMVSHINPATYPASFEGPNNGWDGTGYRIAEPYRSGPILQTKDGIENMIEGEITGEFRHLLFEIFGGLTGLGLVIEEVWEDPRHLCNDERYEPGSNEHFMATVQEYFNILCVKPINLKDK